jgi:hypothetical protein
MASKLDADYHVYHNQPRDRFATATSEGAPVVGFGDIVPQGGPVKVGASEPGHDHVVSTHCEIERRGGL